MNTPTIQQLYQQIMQDYSNRLGTTIPSWVRTIVSVWAGVYAACTYTLYLRTNFVYRNMLPNTADPMSEGGTLEAWGMTLLNRLPYNATQGKYIITGVGTNGTTIPAGRQFRSGRNSTIFTNDTAFVFSSAIQSFEVRALTAGSESRLSAGDTLTIASPVAGVQNDFTVLMETIEPTDAEPIDSYREKVSFAFRYQSRGGSAQDYKYWSQQVVGVRTAYAYTGVTMPNVNLYIESETSNGVPSPSLIQQVETYVNTRRPLGIFVNYLPVQVSNISLTINGAQSLTTSDRILIETSVQTYLRQKRPYLAGVDGSSRNDTVYLNEIISLIQSLFPGVILGNITMFVNGQLYVSAVMDYGFIPQLTQINYN